MKTAHIDAHFPELKGNCYAQGRGRGSTPKIAIARAVSDLFKQRNVKGKRITQLKCGITVLEERTPGEDVTADGPQRESR